MKNILFILALLFTFTSCSRRYGYLQQVKVSKAQPSLTAVEKKSATVPSSSEWLATEASLSDHGYVEPTLVINEQEKEPVTLREDLRITQALPQQPKTLPKNDTKQISKAPLKKGTVPLLVISSILGIVTLIGSTVLVGFGLGPICALLSWRLLKRLPEDRKWMRRWAWLMFGIGAFATLGLIVFSFVTLSYVIGGATRSELGFITAFYLAALLLGLITSPLAFIGARKPGE